MAKFDFQKTYFWAAAQLGGMCTPETAIYSLIYFFYEDNKTCFMSQSEIGRRLGISRTTVYRALTNLKTMGAIGAGACNFTKHTCEYYIIERTAKLWQEEYDLSGD
jgi:biotin operon repressor